MVESISPLVRHPPPLSEARLDTVDDFIERLEQQEEIAEDTSEDEGLSEFEHESVNSEEQATDQRRGYLVHCQHWLYRKLEPFILVPSCLYFIGLPVFILLLSWFVLTARKNRTLVPSKPSMDMDTNQADDLRGKIAQLQDFLVKDMLQLEHENMHMTSLLDEQQSTIQTLYELLEQQVLDDIDAWLNVMLDKQRQDTSMDDLFEHKTTRLDRLERIEKVIASLSRLKQQESSSLQRPNFASLERGARILHALTTVSYSPYGGFVQYMFDIPTKRPEMVLLPDDREYTPWSMRGDKGTLAIVLTEFIEIQEVVLAYPHVLLTIEEILYMPKKVEILGVDYEERTVYSLGNFTYHAHDTQAFIIEPQMLQSKTFRIIMIKIHSNWGSKDRTNIYRIRVYGNARKDANTQNI